ncbi:MAG: SPFH domain-containing protein [Alphaproteobacteria bacterium]|nr:SPFH domain-containing protein [Alphaproteobacteria bacterium]
MSFWNSVKKTAVEHGKAQFLDIIEWLDETRDTIVFRFPVFNQAIQDGGKLVVREGQAAVFVSEGKLSDVFGPGTYELSTRTKAIAGFFESIKYALNYPYKGDVYFVNTRQFTDQKWGTPNPIMMHDKEIGPVRIRAFGNYAYKVTDPAVFIREIVGTSGLFTTSEINGQLKRKLVSGFADTLGESEIPVLRLAAAYMDLGDAMRERLSKWFEDSYGITLTDFVVENVSLPPEVEKMLDKRSSMGLLGDMGKYTQFQTAEAIGKMAERPGGGNAFMDAGMGLAMGHVMGGAVAGGAAPGMAPGGAPPPPPGPALLHYHGPSGQAQLSAQDIAQRVAADRSGAHNVWAPGWPGWKAWREVPEIANLVPPPAAAPPPPPGAGAPVHYTGPDGAQLQIPAGEVAARVAADPGGRHLVWKAGMSGWIPAKDLPEVAQALAAAAPPPPPPPAAGPTPPPPPPADE